MWFKIDDGFISHPKVLIAAQQLGGHKHIGRVVAVWLEAGLYCSKYLTSGEFPDVAARMFLGDVNRKPIEVCAACVEAGLFERTDGGYRFHDWNDYNPTGDEVKADRAWDAKRKALFRIPGLVDAIRRRDGDRCRYCGRIVNWKDRRGELSGTYDHVIPRGENSFANVVVCCSRCNNSKGGRTPEQAGMPLLPEPDSNGSGPHAEVLIEPRSELDRYLALGSGRARLFLPPHVYAGARDPVQSRPNLLSRAEEQGARARPARMKLSIWEVRNHLLAAVHRLIEQGEPYLYPDGTINLTELDYRLKEIAAKDLQAEWHAGRELQSIVEAAIARRNRIKSGEVMRAHYEARERKALERLRRLR